MLGRNIAAMMPTSAVARLAQPLNNNRVRLCVRIAPVAHRRFYATPGRPRAAVGEGATVKRAVAKKTKAASTTTSPVAKAKSARSAATTAAKKEKATAAKQKKAEQLKAKKASERAKAQAKKDKAKIKAKAEKEKLKAKTAKKKTISPEAKEKTRLKELKTAALVRPESTQRKSSWALFIEDHKSAIRPTDEPSTTFLTRLMKDLGAQYRNLPQLEAQRYVQQSAEQRRTADTALDAWIKSHTVEEIAAANRARSILRKKTGHTKRWGPLQDDRYQRPANNYANCVSEFMKDASLSGLNVNEKVKRAATHWKSLSDAEKQSYNRTVRHDSVVDATPQQAAASA